MIGSVFTLTLLLTWSVGLTQSAKILMIPADHHSHVNLFAVTGASLKEAGHDVIILSTQAHQKAIERLGLQHIIFHTSFNDLVQEDFEQLAEGFFSGSILKFFSNVEKIMTFVVNTCTEMLESKELYHQLESAKFDLVIIDGMDPMRCFYIFPYKLGVPYITMNARHDPWTVRIPALPSAEPYFPLLHMDDDPAFWKRLTNLVTYVGFACYSGAFRGVSDELIMKYAPDKPTTTFDALYLNSELWLINFDIQCLDYPRVSSPHYHFVGGLGAGPARPLPAELEQFVAGAQDGVIVVSFGSAIKWVPHDMLKKLCKAFSEVSQRVVMRFGGEVPSDVPTNVLLLKWLPQNDLLGHNNTRLFITHAGNNGQLEALYHGVPMLSMPFFGDQFYNAKRSEIHGYGLTVDPLSFEADDLVIAMKEMINNTSYKDKIQICSSIFHHMKSPHETVTFYVDHVLKFGGGHLKPRYINMPLWKFLMLDIILFLLVCSYITYRSIRWCIRCCCWLCCKHSEKHKQE